MSACRTCQKPIIWVKGYKGPCNPEPVMVVATPGAAGPSSFVIAEKGVVSARKATQDEFRNWEVGARPALVSHFSTCVTAHVHRKPREPTPTKPTKPPKPATRDLFAPKAPLPERAS